MSDANLDRVVSILAARDAAMRPQLDRIGSAIGYGNACHILGELWDDMLEAEGFPRGRGSMERRPERQAAEQWKAQRNELHEALLLAEGLIDILQIHCFDRADVSRDPRMLKVRAAIRKGITA